MSSTPNSGSDHGSASYSARVGSLGSESERSEVEREREPTRAARVSPDPEVVERATRRRFTADYKRRILREIDSASDRGAAGRVLRREGLYASHVATWRKAIANSERSALAPKKRGPKPVAKDPREIEITRLRRENSQLQEQLRRAGLMLDLQKKVSEILGITLPVLEEIKDDEVNV